MVEIKTLIKIKYISISYKVGPKKCKFPENQNSFIT